MSNLFFKKLIILSRVEELAKIVELQPGLNIVTSLRINGNDLGKSIIAKSFYHCMGADCKFDSKFEADTKVFVVMFDYDGQDYIMYRNGSLFKLFGTNHELLWSVSSRHELGQLLYERFGYAIWLPARSTEMTEIAPPAYSYAPYFVDQNEYGGSEFKSFHNLGQYSNYKESLIYTFAGACDQDFFIVKAEKEAADKEKSELEDSIDLNKAMIAKVAEELSTLGYSEDMGTLAKDCDEHETEYRRLSEMLSGYREKLYELREQRAQTELAYEGARALAKHLNKNTNKMNGETCPFCNSRIENSVSARVSACIAHEDTLMLGDELKRDIDEIDQRIRSTEDKYRQSLDELNHLKAGMASMRKNDMTAVQIEGLTRLSKRLSTERGRLATRLDEITERLEKLKKRLDDYGEAKKAVNILYVQIVSAYARQLDLQSIDLGKIKTIGNRFEADGSNAPLATVAWYFALLKLKDELNPDRVCLPLILDSPMNVEADDEKYEKQYGLIFNTFRYQHQMLVTGLGLASSEVVPEGTKVIVLENEKYHLLNPEDYESSREFVFRCIEAQ